MGVILELDDLSKLLVDPVALKAAQAAVSAGSVLVARGVFDAEWIDSTRQYLSGVGRNSLANYEAIRRGAPNFHRINMWDPRAQVMGCFHQFSFFPWNNDPFNFFSRSRLVYQIKNVLSYNDPDTFWDVGEGADYSPRLSFQFYPKGGGGLNRHSDPVSDYQLTVPTMTMSQKGSDFQSGGAYVDTHGERVFTDGITAPGDVVFFNAALPHGVERIDPDEDVPWTRFEGRWVLLFAVNHVGSLHERVNAQDLDR